jgi:hypothetical protein
VGGGRPNHEQTVAEPVEPHRQAAQFGPVAQQIEPGVGVAAQRHGLRQGDDDLLIVHPGKRRLQCVDRLFELRLRPRTEAAVVFQEAAAHHAEILLPGLGAICRLRVRWHLLQIESEGQVPLDEPTGDPIPRVCGVERYQSVPGLQLEMQPGACEAGEALVGPRFGRHQGSRLDYHQQAGDCRPEAPHGPPSVNSAYPYNAAVRAKVA